MTEGDQQQDRLCRGSHPPLSTGQLTTTSSRRSFQALLPAAPGPVGSRHHVTMAPEAGQRCLPSRWFPRGGGLRPGRPRPFAERHGQARVLDAPLRVLGDHPLFLVTTVQCRRRRPAVVPWADIPWPSSNEMATVHAPGSGAGEGTPVPRWDGRKPMKLIAPRRLLAPATSLLALWLRAQELLRMSSRAP